MNNKMTEEQLLKRSKQLLKEREEYVINILNPYEKKNMEFIKQVILFYNINTLEEFNKYMHIMPDCTSRFLMQHHFYKLKAEEIKKNA